MYKVSYYHADTGTEDNHWPVSLERAKTILDGFISNGPSIKKVTALSVEFRNGDSARISNMSPLSAIMLDREDRGYDNDGSDSIFA